ncbi:MAG TPA: polysaccharide biosynthesis/export family protein [Rhabdochlamydiaceae bacterium]|nr:polysaccharide biosynthesis/export family protein [Rhabdochlamydiaceae bacterium]
MKIVLLFLSAIILFASCTNPPYRGQDVLGADEFVMDSYKIREGKFSILQMEGKVFDELSTSFLENYKDTIHEGDVLQIAVYHPNRTDIASSVQAIGNTIGYRVTDGKVLLPDLDAIEVEGLTLDEARKKIQEKYNLEIKDLQVFLTYRERIERKVELAGMVQTPNIPVDGRIRLFEVLSVAKVPTNANFFKSYVVRDDQLLPVDLYKLIKQGDMSQNIVMKGGDKIYIADASASSIMVLGEVNKERVLDVPNGFVTLRHAIADAGGIPFTGNKSYIQVIRGGILNPKIYTLNWKHVIHLPTDSMLLIPGDIVYVAATPIAEWNRFVNQLLPTFIALDLLTKGIKTVGVNVP